MSMKLIRTMERLMLDQKEDGFGAYSQAILFHMGFWTFGF